jgi:methylated-DNA-[protein]-cysteine S-methyltransferase
MRLIHDQQNSPLGTMHVVSDDAGLLYALDFDDCQTRMRKLLTRYFGDLRLIRGSGDETIRNALAAYFAGDWLAISQLATAGGGTPFQRAVWNRLRSIPAKATLTYGQVAREIGRPTANRAVGLATGANPIALVVPCHRVIGASGSLTGFAGGLWRKRWLLEHESGQGGA